MPYIGLISDTHGVFDEEFKRFLEPVDEVWHAGDFGAGADFARSIADFKPLVGVYGNCDGLDVREIHPHHQFFERGGMSVLMMHIGGHPGHYDLRARALIDNYRPQIFVCGHSHILRVIYDHEYEMLTLNPGACGISGWHNIRTALRFRLEDGEVSGMEHFDLPRSRTI